jgi:membrane protein DedA with SNARE-associated domain
MAWLAGWITALIATGGYGGVAVLMALESACVPIPSELIMPFAGYLVSTGRFRLWLVALAGAVGCNLGSAAAYWVGARGGRALVARYGRYVLASVADLDRAERFFLRFGAVAMLIGRMLPLIRTFIALPAGMARMRKLPFHVYTFIGSFIWCLVLAAIGAQLGRAWDSSPALQGWMRRLDGVAVVLAAIALAWFITTHWRRRSVLPPGD